MRMRHIVICGLSGSTVLYNIISWKARFEKIENTMCIFIFYTIFF